MEKASLIATAERRGVGLSNSKSSHYTTQGGETGEDSSCKEYNPKTHGRSPPYRKDAGRTNPRKPTAKKVDGIRDSQTTPPLSAHALGKKKKKGEGKRTAGETSLPTSTVLGLFKQI